MRETLESYERNTRLKKRGERFTNHPHPLAILRKSYGYTQLECANYLGITRQIIVDNELGLSMHPNPKYVAYLAQYDPHARKLISEACYAWRSARRADQDDPDGIRCLVQALQSSTTDLSTLLGIITSTPTQQAPSDAVKGTNSTGSVRGFSRMLILQNSILTSYLKSGHHWGQISIALQECQLSPSLINWLHQLPRTPEHKRHLELMKEKQEQQEVS